MAPYSGSVSNSRAFGPNPWTSPFKYGASLYLLRIIVGALESVGEASR